ncbi:MAG: pseudouridine synthase [Planctomycetia bacterium]|nr:pseudouridine synthase [Planctomycetia bacterium]
MPPIINVAAYQFVDLSDLKSLRSRLRALCSDWQLRGTILLSTEGINLFVAGERWSTDLLLAELRSIAGLENLAVKISASDRPPFNRMLVRIKREIIPFGVPGIDPARRPAAKLSPCELKQWLDEGRPITLLDTRNDYEVKLGTFRDALPIGIQHFRQFPQAADRLPAELKQRPIVMFCTGGIRCEKAGPYLKQQGFEQVFQLEGGILKYFQDCGTAYYQGECFVFDQRVGLDAGLDETRSEQCYACLTPLTASEQQDPRFLKGTSCPYCFLTSAEQQSRALIARQQSLAMATQPLPGSEPYDNYRPIDVPASADGRPLLDFLTNTFRHVLREHWLGLFAGGLFLNIDRRQVEADRVVQAGERYLRWEPRTREPDVNVDIRIVHEDEAVIVLNKPAPLPVHPSGQFNRNTLTHILSVVYQPQRPRAAHRLDANTSGLIVFARTRHMAGLLQPQFARGEVEKVYLARIQGHPPENRFRSTAPISSEAGEGGSRVIDEQDGLPAVTEFTVRRRLNDGTALIEARPLTGRTNQIRVHLWELGWPICGEQLYLKAHQLGVKQTVAVNDPPLELFAKQIAFTHPLSGKRRTFVAPSPPWADELRES